MRQVIALSLWVSFCLTLCVCVCECVCVANFSVRKTAYMCIPDGWGKKLRNWQSFGNTLLFFPKPYFTQILCPLTIFESTCRRKICLLVDFITDFTSERKIGFPLTYSSFSIALI